MDLQLHLQKHSLDLVVENLVLEKEFQLEKNVLENQENLEELLNLVQLIEFDSF